MTEIKEFRDDLHQMEKRIIILEQKVDQIDTNVKKIADALGYLAKIAGGTLVAAIAAWIFKGGLSGG